MTYIFSLAELYQLKDVHRNTPRVCVARLFFQENAFGLKDISGALWPIAFEQIHTDDPTFLNHFNPGDVIQFFGQFKKNLFSVHKIIQKVTQTSGWNHSFIPEPQTELMLVHLSDALSGALPTRIESIGDEKRTQYFSYQTSHRLEFVEKRNAALERTKQFFQNRDFFYAHTPILVPSGGMETYLHTFQTIYRDYQQREWTFELPTSPEFALKKLLAEGVPKVFQLAPSFRNNGEHSAFHEPEFTMLEWYRSGGSLKEILQDTQKLVQTLASFLNSKHYLPKEWKTFRVPDLFYDLLNLNLEELQNEKDFYEKSKHLSLSLRTTDTWDDIFCKLFMEKIEPFLKKQIACFVTGYPIQMSALAQNEPNNRFFVQRAEAYLFGIEICNGYQELVDVHEFELRFQKTYANRSDLRRDAHFENVMKFGLPPCTGNAVGIDRVIALLLELPNIQSLLPLPFPTAF